MPWLCLCFACVRFMAKKEKGRVFSHGWNTDETRIEAIPQGSRCGGGEVFGEAVELVT